MSNLDVIKQIDLAGFLGRHYGIQVGSNGGALCPFHDDHNPSFSVTQKNGIGLFTCHACEAKGTILDFVMRKEGLSLSDAARRVEELEGIRDERKGRPLREHLYRDENGAVVYKKVKYGKGIFPFYHPNGTEWVKGKGDHQHIPYRLDKIKDEPTVIICEGEKDAETLAALGYPATSGPTGKDHWPEELNQFFKGKEIRLIYDVGNDEAIHKVARKLSAVTDQIYILRVPLEEKEADITDYLNQFSGPEEKRLKFIEIVTKGERYKNNERCAFIGSLGDFFNAEIPESEPLIEGFLRREEFLYIGGVKHSHKTSILMSLGLHFAAGLSPWLNFKIPRAGKVLLIQQELGEWEWRQRLQKAIDHGGFDPSVLDRFITYTGTGNPIKVMTDQGFSRLEVLVKKYCPDILGLDPQASFCVGKENDDTAQAFLRDRLNYLKTKYKLSIAMSHHFSSKRPAGDPTAPTELAGWFRGHTILSDAADAQFGLHRLPGQRTNPNLPRAYENYNQVEINLRNGKWPPKFAIEFIEESFLVKLSNVWQEAGFRIPVGDVREVCDAHGGSILLADLILYYKAQIGEVSAVVVKRAVNRDADAGLVEMEKLKGKGSPILIKSKEKKT